MMWMIPNALLEDLEDFVDVKASITACVESLSPCSGPELLERYERLVDWFAELEVEVAFALDVPGLGGAARRHAEATRRLVRAHTSLARTMLPA